MNTANSRGAEVTIVNILQSASQRASHGRMHAAMVKNIAMDMFATKVLHLGPTYSKTEKKDTDKYFDVPN